MKIHLSGPTRTRAILATLRNCITYENSPYDCPVRKCRRDGCCSGPLARDTDGHIRLAAAPDDPGNATVPVPLCWFSLSESQLKNVRMALGAGIRALDRQPAPTVIETTRAIGGRRWKRLRDEW